MYDKGDYGRRIHYKLSTRTPHYNDFTHKFIYQPQTNVFADVIFAPLLLSFYLFLFLSFLLFFLRLEPYRDKTGNAARNK